MRIWLVYARRALDVCVCACAYAYASWPTLARPKWLADKAPNFIQFERGSPGRTKCSSACKSHFKTLGHGFEVTGRGSSERGESSHT